MAVQLKVVLKTFKIIRNIIKGMLKILNGIMDIFVLQLSIYDINFIGAIKKFQFTTLMVVTNTKMDL